MSASEKDQKRVLVVGGGAAGMMAAIVAARSGASVILLEKNEKLGKKLFITGKGRCNVTNAGSKEDFFANVMRNPKFLYSAFSGFDNKAMMEFLEKAGCRLKVERGERVFPVSDHSSDVIAALSRELAGLGVEVRLRTEVRELLRQEGIDAAAESSSAEKGFSEVGSAGSALRGDGLAEVGSADGLMEVGWKEEKDPGGSRVTGVRLANGKVLRADAVILATGGISYPSTGSTGDGYRFAEDTGHRLTERAPSLVPFTVKEGWCSELMGLSLRNVTVRLQKGKKQLYQGFGEMLFTHFGISGPLILSASSYYAADKMRKKKGSGGTPQAIGETPQEAEEGVRLLIDLKPALDEAQLDRRLMRDLEENHNKQFKNSLNALFPAKLIPVMVSLSGIDPEKKSGEVSRQERQSFGRLIKNLPLTVTGTRDFEEAIITRGGVDVRDVNPSTMESKRLRGLYFAGELMDLDALTGGYNLQIAWSTGYLAGKSAAGR